MAYTELHALPSQACQPLASCGHDAAAPTSPTVDTKNGHGSDMSDGMAVGATEEGDIVGTGVVGEAVNEAKGVVEGAMEGESVALSLRPSVRTPSCSSWRRMSGPGPVQRVVEAVGDVIGDVVGDIVGGVLGATLGE